ncbi:carbon monoxide dehydrogenase subunit G (plasmid) [Agrobacterium salinitolerans]|uniref:Carbon monoxide dehydrogenase subunit G n=1 Tax=Agrobacterium salinitolerans TaxID=1183413 RepID=A0A4Z1R7G7_9HYPH|nr:MULTISPECIES: carbon monoxide dehydrogenase subunit G [Agrobacterium]MDH6298098.1 carbon monoxide dehydrogenase subunit G [Agrobacterium fabrum]UYZ11086.1 carbon monoxide dehydrogenase subunit G [Agrobacterium salinitolerans]
MEISGQQLIPATKEEVWAALNDPDVLKVCIPGCQELTKSSDTEMAAVAVMKVGPVKARFQGAVRLSDLDPPNGYKITGEGQGGVAGFAKGIAVVKLSAADGGTVLDYTVEAQIGGKLSQLGGRLIDVTAKQMAGQFFKRFAEEIHARQNPQEATVTAQLVGTGSSPAQTKAVSPQSDMPAMANARHSAQPAVTTGSGVSLPVLALVVFASVLVALWVVYGGLLPSLAPAADMPSRISPDLASIVQLVMAAAIGYLFGRTSK